jgi:hypothetical protein
MTTVGFQHVSAVDARHHENVTILPAVLRRTTWGAVFAGAVSAIGVQFILTVLGIAIGVSSAGIVSLMVGGAVLGRTAGIQRSIDVLLHAFAMWAVTAIFGFLMIWATAGVASAAGASAAGSLAWNPGFTAQHGDPRWNSRSSGTDTRSTLSTSEDGRVSKDNAADRLPALREPPLADAEKARHAAQTASWWTLVGLLMGVGAALGGTWMFTSDRFVVRPPNVATP